VLAESPRTVCRARSEIAGSGAGPALSGHTKCAYSAIWRREGRSMPAPSLLGIADIGGRSNFWRNRWGQTSGGSDAATPA
jgi:hypothetical protein